MDSLIKYEALKYWKQKRKTPLKRFLIEGHTLSTAYCDPVSLSKVNYFQDCYISRLNSASSCIWDAYIYACYISRWSELNHYFPPSVFFY